MYYSTLKREENSVIYNNMNESERQRMKLNKQRTEREVPHELTQRSGKQKSGYQSWLEEWTEKREMSIKGDKVSVRWVKLVLVV
jgi:hypothetical protein